MQIEENKSLKAYNTFGIDSKASHFISVRSEEELKETLSLDLGVPKFILGGGSNLLLTGDLQVLVIHIDLKGIQLLTEDDNTVVIEAAAGENWHEFVQYCLDKGYGGLENLSLIPGNVGTAPIQNIGAYGVELKDMMVSCRAMNTLSREMRIFRNEDCGFGYRTSIFKEKEKGNFIITSVQFELTKRDHRINTSYGTIAKELQDMGVDDPGPAEVSEAVIAIRQSKLPDPAVLGNSGSFFKNPLVSAEIFAEFHQKYPDAPYYKMNEESYKIPAGWLIEKTGLKGKRFGDAGVHEKQALVLVNYGNASGSEIWSLAQKIRQKVRQQFGIELQPEVNVIEV